MLLSAHKGISGLIGRRASWCKCALQEGIDTLKYAIIGSGNIGSAVARQFARAGIAVGVATSRGPDAVAPLVEAIGPQVVPVEVGDALLADYVILATPFEAVRELTEQIADWGGRIIIDATNAIDYTDFSAADLGGKPSSDVVQDMAPSARVVKAFGHTWARVLAREPGDEHGGRRVQFLSGNHSDANAEVAQLIEQLGFAPIDLGGTGQGGLLIQFGGPLTAHSFISQPIGGASPPEMDLIDR